MKFDDIRKLHQKRYRQALGYFLVEGEHPVLELQKAAARNPALQACELDVTKENVHWRSPFETHVLNGIQMAQISDTRGESLQAAGFTESDCCWLGTEARALQRDQLANLDAKPSTIAGGGAIESLNLASAVNMCVYELNRP